MVLSNIKQTWKRNREWGRSVPEVPDDHVEPPRDKVATRFDGNHGSWMAPLGIIALVLCLLATLSTPLCETMSLVEFIIQSDFPGASGTTQKVKLGLWGLCWDGPDGDCSKLRGVFSSFAGATSSLPERFVPLVSILGDIPQSFLDATGVFPIFANAYIYFGAVYAAWSATFFGQKMRRTAKWQWAAIACYHWVIIWLSISLGLMISFYQKINAKVASSDVKQFVHCKIGISVWLMLTSLILMLWSAIIWQTWRFNLKRGTWQPAAWIMYIGNPEDQESTPSNQAITSTNVSAQTSKDAEAHSEKRDLSDCVSTTANEEHNLPTYTAAPSSGETVMTVDTSDPSASSIPAGHDHSQPTPASNADPKPVSTESVLPPHHEERSKIARDSSMASVQLPATGPHSVTTNV